MDFLKKMSQAANDLGKMTQDFASDTKTKADNAIQISKLNGKINDLKKENENIKYQLGSKYFDVKTGASTEGVEEIDKLVLKIQANLREIENLNTQIGEIKVKEAGGGKVCPKCGNVVNENAKFCTKCGFRFEEGE